MMEIMVALIALALAPIWVPILVVIVVVRILAIVVPVVVVLAIASGLLMGCATTPERELAEIRAAPPPIVQPRTDWQKWREAGPCSEARPFQNTLLCSSRPARRLEI
jgi:hypothetical protein